MSGLPEPYREPEAGPPERRLSPEEFELVIRRAAELQAKSAEDASGEAMSEEEVLRIGRELGLSASHMQQALAEVRGKAPPERGLLFRLMGAADVRATRTVAGEADEVRQRLESYLLEWEFLSVLRRFPDRTVYEPASGVAAAVGRAVSRLGRNSPRLQLQTLEVVVQPLEPGFSHVTLAASLASQRAGWATSGVLGGGAGGGTVAVVLGIAVAPPAALLGLPILGGALYGARYTYGAMLRRTQLQLESLLDRLQHGELPASTRGWQQRLKP